MMNDEKCCGKWVLYEPVAPGLEEEAMRRRCCEKCK